MLGSTEKAFHIVGRTALALIAVLFVGVVIHGIYNINMLEKRRLALTDVCDRLDEAMAANRPQPIERERYLEKIQGDWESTSRPKPLKFGVFYKTP